MPTQNALTYRKPNWSSRSFRPILLAGLALLLIGLTGSCLAQDASPADVRDAEETSGWTVEQWYIFTSLYTKHWDPEPDHTDHQHWIGPEIEFENDYLVGLAFFQNSFDQSSQFLYIGKTWGLFKTDWFYFKLVGGLLHGYKEPYEDKIPFNGLGIAPAILPSFGLRYKRVMEEVQIEGAAAITITAGLIF